jgi:hypothetical protein
MIIIPLTYETDSCNSKLLITSRSLPDNTHVLTGELTKINTVNTTTKISNHFPYSHNISEGKTLKLHAQIVSFMFYCSNMAALRMFQLKFVNLSSTVLRLASVLPVSFHLVSCENLPHSLVYIIPNVPQNGRLEPLWRCKQLVTSFHHKMNQSHKEREACPYTTSTVWKRFMRLLGQVQSFTVIDFLRVHSSEKS